VDGEGPAHGQGDAIAPEPTNQARDPGGQNDCGGKQCASNLPPVPPYQRPGRRRVKFISNMIDRWRVWNTLLDYPEYSPPFHDSELVLSKKEIKANYDYFLEQKAGRLEYLANYLRPFSVELPLLPEALPALDRWLSRYGGHLIPGGGELMAAIHDCEPAWVREFHGLNIVHDIAIFAGEYVISQNENVRWDVYYGNGTRRDYEEVGFGQPCLIGLSHPDYKGDRCAIFAAELLRCCVAGHYRLRHRPKGVVTEWDVPGHFVKRLTDLANPDPEPLPSYHEIIMAQADRSRRKPRS